MANSFRDLLDLTRVFKDRILSRLATISDAEVLMFTKTIQIKVDQELFGETVPAKFTATGITVDGYVLYKDLTMDEQEIFVEDLDIYELAYIADLVADKINYRILQV
jgi:hypothetical protein